MEQVNQRPGCLSGILRLFVLERVYRWLQRNLGFGRGCTGAGCGVVFFVVFILFACSILFGTNWFDLRF